MATHPVLAYPAAESVHAASSSAAAAAMADAAAHQAAGEGQAAHQRLSKRCWDVDGNLESSQCSQGHGWEVSAPALAPVGSGPSQREKQEP